MFTGIIEDIGKVRTISFSSSQPHLEIETKLAPELEIGASISVNGVCLTVNKTTRTGFLADVSRETLQASALGALKPSAFVNLERAVQSNQRLDGHLVQGHVDHVGGIVAVAKAISDWVLTVKFPPLMAQFVANKGSIAIDGVSLTVSELEGDHFKVHVIPHTLAQTIIQYYRPTAKVNLETDILGRYVVRWLELQSPVSR